MKSQIFVYISLALCATVHSQEETTTELDQSSTSTTTNTPTTPWPGQSYGALCNGLLLRCNRYSETVACLQRRPDPTTTTTGEPELTTEDPIIAMFQRSAIPAPAEICETGLGVDLGRCQCSRNCKNGVYVDDGEFDEDREICVGLVGSTCSLLVPNCVRNGRCNFLTSKCICDVGFVEQNRRCVPRK